MPKSHEVRLSPTRLAAIAFLAGLVYVLGAKLGLALRVEPSGIAAVWPPSGIMLAIFLVIPRQAWWPAALAIVVANVPSNLIGGRSLALSLAYAAASSLEPWLGAMLIRRYLRRRVDLRSLRQVALLLVFGAGVSSAAGATLAATATRLSTAAATFPSVWGVWFVSAAMSVVVLSPLILVWWYREPLPAWRLHRRRTVEGVLLLVLLGAAAQFSYGLALEEGQAALPVFYLTFPLGFLAALRFGVRGAATASLVLFGVGVLNILLREGALVPGLSAGASLQWLQVYSSASAVSFLCLAALWMEREDAAAAREAVIEELEEKKEELFQAQRMEALGRLAGGLAHDINNLLMAVGGNVELALKARPGEDVGEFLEQIGQASDRGAQLVRQLLAFARRRTLDREAVVAERIVVEVADLVRSTFDRSIAIRTNVADDLPAVMAEESLVHQILLNLCLNARDAIEELPAGGPRESSIYLSVERTELVAGASPTRFGVEAGSFVRFSVRDTGVGIAPAVRQRLFEPFFSTKDRDQGSGLGLATAYSIVQRHGGWFEVESEDGRGAAFHFHLPVATGPTSPAVGPAESTLPGQAMLCVLIVDDESLVRETLTRLLETAGWDVLAASTGEEAVGILDAKGPMIDVVLLDLSMPGWTGEQTLIEIRRRGHEQPVVVASGDLSDERQRGLAELGPDAVLTKPFRAHRLIETVRQVFERSVIEATVSGSEDAAGDRDRS